MIYKKFNQSHIFNISDYFLLNFLVFISRKERDISFLMNIKLLWK